MNATRVSGSSDLPPALAPAGATGRAVRALARSSLLALTAMSSSACLVISPPEYEHPKQTSPFLVATEAFPSLTEIIGVDALKPFVEFGGAVLSEDNGTSVQLALYVDYGQPNAAGLPYKNRVYPFEPIPPGTIADGPRNFQGKKWFLDSVPVSPGCHTITMMASHEFNASVCPVDQADSSFLTWQVIRCDDPNDMSCPTKCQPLACEEECPSCATLAADAGVEEGGVL